MITENLWLSSPMSDVKTAHGSDGYGLKCLLISDSVINVRIKHSTFSAGSQPVAT